MTMNQCWQRRAAPGAILLSALGCSQAIDWREMRPEGTELAVAMPCKPGKQEDSFLLAGQRAQMRVFACRSNGALFALGHIRLADATQAGAALTSLAAAASANARGTVGDGQPAQVAGMTPLPQARQWRWEGEGRDQKPTTAWVTVFSYGPHVYQATVIGTPAHEALAQHFRAALAVRPAGLS
jgi:hypothetical protein